DAWALPSHGENFGNAAVEALASGRACVLSPSVSVAHEAAAAGAAVVADIRPTAVARTLRTLVLGSEARRAALATNARAFARRYSFDDIGPQMAGMYESVLRRN